jgi:hypothetical protein
MDKVEMEVDADIAPIVSAFIETLKANLAAERRLDELPHEEAAAFVGVSSNTLRHARRGGFFEIPGECHKAGRVWFYRISALKAWKARRSAAKAA